MGVYYRTGYYSHHRCTNQQLKVCSIWDMSHIVVDHVTCEIWNPMDPVSITSCVKNILIKTVCGCVSIGYELACNRVGSGPICIVVCIVCRCSKKGLVVYNSGNNSRSCVLNIQLAIACEYSGNCCASKFAQRGRGKNTTYRIVQCGRLRKVPPVGPKINGNLYPAPNANVGAEISS